MAWTWSSTQTLTWFKSSSRFKGPLRGRVFLCGHISEPSFSLSTKEAIHVVDEDFVFEIQQGLCIRMSQSVGLLFSISLSLYLLSLFISLSISVLFSLSIALYISHSLYSLSLISPLSSLLSLSLSSLSLSLSLTHTHTHTLTQTLRLLLLL